MSCQNIIYLLQLSSFWVYYMLQCNFTDLDEKKSRQKQVKHDRSYLHTLILAHDTGQLKITFDLLPDLLKAVHDGYRGDGMYATQNV